MAASFDLEWERGRDRLSAQLRELLARGREVRALDYQQALARIPLLNESFDELFVRFDAILTPAAPGTAPRGLDSTGDPAFCTLWTLCGMPAISLPLMRGTNGLPLGVQLVGPRARRCAPAAHRTLARRAGRSGLKASTGRTSRWHSRSWPASSRSR